MNIFRKVLRIVFLTILIILACSGVGMIPLNRYRFMGNETRIELVEYRNEEEDEGDSEART